MPPLRIGLIGAGRIVPVHLRGYAALRQAGFDDFRITAICSRDPARARSLTVPGADSGTAVDPVFAPVTPISELQDDTEVRIFTDVRDMLDAGVVDAVDITTEVSLHHTQAITCLEAGVHALVEKPLAITVRAGRLMVEAAGRNNVQLAVSENARWHRQVRIAQWLVKRGDLGDPQMVTIVSIGTDKWSPDAWVGNSSWRHRRLIAAGGASLDHGPHVFHRLRALCGEVQSVSGLARVFEPTRYLRDDAGAVLDTVTADADDSYSALINFESGAIGHVTYSFAGHGPATLQLMPTLYGSRGCLLQDRLYQDGQEPTTIDEYFERHAGADADWVFPLGMTDPFGLLIGDWLRGIREGRPAETSGAQGLRDLAASFAIVESAQAGRAVRLTEVLDGSVEAYQQDLNEHYGIEG